MKLGTQTGSLMNHIMSNTSVHEIIPGETGATLLGWTDRHPATVVDLFNKGDYTYIVVQADEWYVESGSMHDGSAKYAYLKNPKGYKSIFRFKTDGSSGFQKVAWNKETNRYNKISNGGLSVGQRDKYYDPHF